MKLKKLQSNVVEAQQQLQAGQIRALEARQKAKAAKARFQQAKLERKRSRKEAAEAKAEAREANDDVCQQARRVFKLEKRLARALKRQKGKVRQPAVPPAMHRPAHPARRSVLPQTSRIAVSHRKAEDSDSSQPALTPANGSEGGNKANH